MKKRKLLFLISIFFFFFLLLCVIFLSINLNYILNHPKVKSKIFNFIKTSKRIDFKYEKINVNLFKKNIKIKALSISNKRFKFHSPYSILKFSLKKNLFYFNFSPKEVILHSPKLKIYHIKKKRPINWAKISARLSQLEPMILEIKNGEIQHESSLGWIKLIKINGKSTINKHQILAKFIASSPSFKSLSLKGRLDYKRAFLESSLSLEQVDLSKFRLCSHKGILKTAINLRAELNLEKGVLNIGFIGSAPCMVLKKAPSENFICGIFQGLAVIKKDQKLLKINLIDMKYPLVKGKIKFEKSSKEYFIEASIKKLNLTHITPIILKFVNNKKKIKDILHSIKKGILYDINFETSGKNLKELFSTSNFILSAKTKNLTFDLSQIEISKKFSNIPLQFQKTTGEISLHNKIFHFHGNSIINKNIFADIKNFSVEISRNPHIYLKANIQGNGENIRKTSLVLFKKKLKFLKNYHCDGDTFVKLEIKGKFPKPHIKVELKFKKVLAKIPYYKNTFLVESGELMYKSHQVFLSKFVIKKDRNFIKNFSGIIDLKKYIADFDAQDIWILEDLLKDLSKDYPKLDEIFSKYKISFKGISLDKVSCKVSLKKKKANSLQNLRTFKNLIAEGKIIDLKLEYLYKGKKFLIKSPSFIWKLENNKLTLRNSKIWLDDSPFEVEGNYTKGYFNLKGSGIVNKKLASKLIKLKNIPEKLSFNSPIYISNFTFFYTNNILKYTGFHQINKIWINLNFTKEKDKFKFVTDLEGKKSKFYIKFDFDKKYIIKIKGKIDLKEISNIFENRYKMSGLIKADLDLDFSSQYYENVKDTHHYSKNFIKDLIYSYLNNQIDIKKSDLILKDINILYKFSKFLINSKIEWNKDQIKIYNTKINWNDSQIEGNLVFIKNGKYLKINGNLTGNKADLRKSFNSKYFENLKKKKGKKEFSIFKKFVSLPVVLQINCNLKSLILPSSHQLEDLQWEMVYDKEKKFKIKIIKANFCGILMNGRYEKDLKSQELVINILPSSGDLLDFVSCLYPEEMPKVMLEGPFEIKGYLHTSGEKSIFENFLGKFVMNSKNGYLYRAPLITKVLGFLSPIDLFKGKIPDLESHLLPYEELNIKGDIKNNNLNISKLFLSAPGFRLFGKGNVELPIYKITDKRIKFIFYASPFKTVDVILEYIPGVKKILGKERMLVYIPIEVTGTYEDFTIIPLHPKSIGRGIYDFIFRIFGIPKEFYKPSKESKEIESPSKK